MPGLGAPKIPASVESSTVGVIDWLLQQAREKPALPSEPSKGRASSPLATCGAVAEHPLCLVLQLTARGL